MKGRRIEFINDDDHRIVHEAWKLDLAIRLWKEGISQNLIARQLGISKGAMAGIISRKRELFPRRASIYIGVKRGSKYK